MAASTVDQLDISFSFEQILSAIDLSLGRRLDVLESRVNDLDNVSAVLEEKINKMPDTIFRPSEECHASIDKIDFTIEKLNSKDDYPNGTWLGDERDPHMRVRCGITPLELFQIESTCRSAKKMALMLMDFLFDRKTMACSSVSGGGRYGKHRLDPVKISAIKFHLRHRFRITNDDWHHIRNNIDSKCRTAFRRKLKGMPLGPYWNRSSVVPASAEDDHEDTLPSSANVEQATEEAVDHDDTLTEIMNSNLDQHQSASSLIISKPTDIKAMTLTGDHVREVIQTANGPIRVLHATTEELIEIRRNHQIIRILADEEQDVVQLVNRQSAFEIVDETDQLQKKSTDDAT